MSDTRPMRPFARFIGLWNTRGRVLQVADMPGGELLATDSYRWWPGGHFIVHEADARMAGEPARSLEIMGYDAKQRVHVSRAYDDRGGCEDFTLALDGRDWRIRGARVRFDGRFDARGRRLEGLWEMRPPRGRWQPWIELQLARAAG